MGKDAGVSDRQFFLQEQSGALFFGYFGTGGLVYLQSAAVLAVNRWYHVLGQRRGSTFDIFVNGRLEATGITSGTQGTLNSTVAELCLMRRSLAGTPAWVQGWLQSARFYNRALGSGEVAALYEAERRGHPEDYRWLRRARMVLSRAAPAAGGGGRARRAFDCASPIDRACPLNRGLQAWYGAWAQPGWAGNHYCRDLTGRNLAGYAPGAAWRRGPRRRAALRSSTSTTSPAGYRSAARASSRPARPSPWPGGRTSRPAAATAAASACWSRAARPSSSFCAATRQASLFCGRESAATRGCAPLGADVGGQFRALVSLVHRRPRLQR